jgi:hypothetical protein
VNDRDVRERLHQREEPVAHDHGRGGDPGERGHRRDSRPGRAVRRLEPLFEGRQPTYTYNWLGLQRYTIAADQALPAGKATIRFEFAYDGGGMGKGGMGTLFVNDKNVATGHIEQTQCCAFSADEGADVGADEGTPVTEAYKVPNEFTGKIDKVTIELKDVKKAEIDDAEQARRFAALKKGLAD